MPASHQSSTANVSQPAILLLEKYDALAAAICSALKKFAPRHAPIVAQSIDEAETLAGKTKPDLFIIDFDPSYPGLSEFLQKMRKTLADARALILTGRIPAEFRGFGALQFVQKPYDLATFGATVQALLVPVALTQSHRTLRNLGLADIIALQCVGGRTTILDVKGTAGDTGAVQIANNHIVHAETDQSSGVRALIEMVKWPSPRVQETAKRVAAARTIQGPWASILLDAWQRGRPEEAEEKKPRAKTGKKIVIVDDTEMLVIFAEDVLSLADAELQITKALTGVDGLKEIEQILPDLVLLDYSLPDINGDEVCRRLLANEQTAHIPVLMMSGHVAEMNATAARFGNVVATIEKPFLSEPFVDLVKKTLASGPRPELARGRRSAPKSEPKAAAPAKAQEAKIEWPVAEEAIPGAPLPWSPSPATDVAPPARTATPEKVEAPPVVPSVPSISAPFPAKIAPPGPVEAPTFSTLVAASGENEVVLGIFLEVLSMQLTPELRMGAIRARPASPTVSLHFLSPAARGALPESGFQLGATELDEKGRLATLRLIPTAKPFQPAATRNAFEIGGVALVRGDHRARVQLTPAGTTPMTMELLARLELSRVALSATFQVEHLVLKWRGSLVRITLDPKAPEQSGALFNVAVKLDTLGQISELLLNATK